MAGRNDQVATFSRSGQQAGDYFAGGLSGEIFGLWRRIQDGLHAGEVAAARTREHAKRRAFRGRNKDGLMSAVVLQRSWRIYCKYFFRYGQWLGECQRYFAKWDVVPK